MDKLLYTFPCTYVKKVLYYKIKKLSPTLIVARCVNDECGWRCRVAFINKSQKWEVRRLIDEHFCSSLVISQDYVNLGYVYISKSILPLMESDPSILIPTIIAHIKSAEGYTIYYQKAWMAKQKAIEDLHDNWEQSYHDLPKLLNAMKYFLMDLLLRSRQGHYTTNKVKWFLIMFNSIEYFEHLNIVSMNSNTTSPLVKLMTHSCMENTKELSSWPWHKMEITKYFQLLLPLLRVKAGA
uniref:Transposase MuDR plant domain-containing protein n=1 Tax=Cajanus cajan TaxID=3821 RepID=A0A151RKN7_CAJCA|nr:hypothetical protein KK1_035451 [Cajanus cajan]